MLGIPRILSCQLLGGLLMLVALSMSGCDGSDSSEVTSTTVEAPVSTTQQAPVSATLEALVGIWELEQISFESSHPTASGIRTWISFSQDGSIDGESPCNFVRGSYTVAGTTLLTDGVTATARGCDPDNPNVDQDLDDRVLDHFWQSDGATVSFAADGDELTWVTPESTAVFLRAAAPPE